ncbi:MAG: rod shape-determining protein MreC [Lachnospiraceae bacterium]|jgi:rod shape-determining protein MreC
MGTVKKRTKHTIPAKYILTFLSCSCALLIIVSFISEPFGNTIKNSAAQIVVPVQKGMNHVGLWLADKSDTIKEYAKLQDENKELKQKLADIQSQNSILIQQQSELEKLRELYQLDDIYSDYPKVAARVISMQPDNWFSEFTIDKGSEDGIEVDMNVLADAGLVGRVTYVGKNYSKVTTIINDSSNVSAKSASTSDNCIVSGDLELMNEGYIRVSGISKDAGIKDGDMLLTSYISDKYLPGILIGYITNITDDGNKLTKSGYLMPVVDFSQIEEVLVITQLKETVEDDTAQ